MSYSNYYTASKLFHGSMSSIMGTQLDLLMIGEDAELLTTVWDRIQKELERLAMMMNRFNPKSEISILNQTASLYPVLISKELWAILQDCKRYYELTRGCFDITLQGFDQVLFEEADHSVFFLSESLQMDLGGFGKGYALAKIETLLKEAGIGNALVNFGNSSILALGKHPCGAYWPIGLDNPFTKERLADIKLCDHALSISGNAPSHTHHIVDPRTGMFVEGRKIVSVVAKDPIIAEVLTTALMVVKEEDVFEIASHFDIYEKQVYTL
ncbi:MAG: FAD:protein FMN transferase [Parabacteroides sp.]|nr:FAD:protein FMN transferase [Parabacteroides sp.]